MKLDYQSILKATYTAIMTSDIFAVLDIEANLSKLTEKNILTKAQICYIFNKVNNFTKYWYNEVLVNAKLFNSLNNNYKLDTTWIARICMYMKYMPQNENKGLMFKNIIKFLIHTKHKFSKDWYERYIEKVCNAAMYQLNCSLQGDSRNV